MRRSLFSQSWHSVASLKPRLMPQARISRHLYRGKPWFIIQDAAGSRYHRVSPNAHSLIARMDGSKTMQELWEEVCRLDGDNRYTQDEIVELLMQLHANDLLYCDVSPDAAELLERYKKHRRSKWKQWLLNPMSLKFPLWNPDAFLEYLNRHFSWVFGKTGAALWLAAILPAAILAVQHWRELTENLPDRTLSPQNLLLLALLFPAIKLLHELGHGLAAKAWGGSVHEMGVMFLVFAPLPYVNTSSASAFHSKYRRAIVGAAGMLVETFLAALAIYVWLLVEPGLVRAIAFNVILIAGVSTLIVNGNPLLRFDGYFMLCDLIEMPNLAQRGQKYYRYLADRYLFRSRDTEPPQESPAEKRWLAFYTVASWVYRVLVVISIILFIAGEFFIFGVLIALWGAFTLFALPVWKAVKHVLESPTLHRNRAHAVRVSLSLLACTILAAGVIPMPLRTQAEGVVWLPDQALLRAGESGYFSRWLATTGSRVERGTPLLLMEDPQLSAELESAQGRLAEAQARYNAEQFANPAQAEVLREKLEYEKQTVRRISERHARLLLRSESEGILTVPNPQDMDGQYFKKGDLLGYVLEHQQLIARVAVQQDNIDLVRTKLNGVDLRFSDDIRATYPVSVLRETPGGVDELPTAALGPAGGGLIPVDPKDGKGLKTLERVFLLDLNLPPEGAASTFGGRVFVRFRHESEPLLSQWHRRLRQLFLSHFHV
ncbi:MAG: M50 family peptidase [Gallionellaceae bacterium]|nr:MAG: M50 family peptidase [Gallionellaceae bacterium]